MSAKKTRKYRAPLRKEHAQATRAAILSAARALFAKKGYVKTSLADIARGARVSVQTIYDSVGSKAQIVTSLNDLIDSEGGVLELLPQRRAAKTAREAIALHVRTARFINERCGDLLTALYAAAPLDKSAAKVGAEGARRHHLGAGMTARSVAQLGGLRAGVTEAHAQALISLTTLPQALLDAAVRTPWDILEPAITDMLCDALLKKAP